MVEEDEVLRARMRAWRAAGSYRELGRQARMTVTEVSDIAAGKRPCPVHRRPALEAALVSRPTRRRPGRPLDSGSDAAWRNAWTLVEARPVSVVAVEAAERAVQRLALLPCEKRADEMCQQYLQALAARSDAFQTRAGPTDHAIARDLLSGAFRDDQLEWPALTAEVKSYANNLRRWVTRRQSGEKPTLPDWVYDDDDALEPHPRARVTLAQLRAIRAWRATPPSAQQDAVETLCHELVAAARWARTVEHQQQDAPAQAKRRRRAVASIALDHLCRGISEAAATATGLPQS